MDNNITIVGTRDSINGYNGGRCFMAELTLGKHAAIVTISDDAVRVFVQNASHRVWRGMGQQFETGAAAIAHYKTPAIKAIIEAAFELMESSTTSTYADATC